MNYNHLLSLRWPAPGEGWRHYKGGPEESLYEIVGISHDTETGHAYVVYKPWRALTTPHLPLFHRPLHIFLGMTDSHVPRFVFERRAMQDILAEIKEENDEAGGSSEAGVESPPGGEPGGEGQAVPAGGGSSPEGGGGGAEAQDAGEGRQSDEAVDDAGNNLVAHRIRKRHYERPRAPRFLDGPILEQELPPSKFDMQGRRMTRCQADDDGMCDWVKCPQLRDGEPAKTRRHCPWDKPPYTSDEE